MSLDVLWDIEAWDDYVYWQTQDKKTLRRINLLIASAARTPTSGPGEPEALKGDLAGWWSRRINEKDRLVYQQKDGHLRIAQCRGHYGDH